MPIRSVVAALLLVLQAGVLPAQDAADTTAAPGPGAPVVVHGDTVLRVHAALGPLTPTERADAIAARLARLERDITASDDSIYVLVEEGRTLIMLGERPLMSVLAGDATAEGASLEATAARYRDALATAFAAGSGDYRLQAIIRGLAFALLATAIAFAIGWLLHQVMLRIERLVGFLRASGRLPTLRFQKLELLTADRIADAALGAVRVIRVAAWVVLGYFYLIIVLSFFPWTRPLSGRILEYVLAPLSLVGRNIVDYLPNLFFIAVIVLVTRWVLHLIRFLFRAIEAGTITLQGFEREWAEPTYKLVRVLVLAFSLVVLWPYLPGSGSDAFKGVSIFVGVLFSLGSTGAVANLVAGTLLTYTRSFNVGDRVRIGDTLGDVLGRTLLVTRVRTLTNIEVTIPNSQVISGSVLNYTRLAAEQGVALQATITIGYDVPWRRVHELLLAAAAATEGIVKEPAPFVLQTGLNDYYPAYELNAFTHDAARMRFTLSALHSAIQDEFARGGVEITSPAFMAIRKGDASTIPDMGQ